MVTSLVVFSFFIKPEKYCKCDENAIAYNPASRYNTQILNRFSFGCIEYNSTFAEMHKKPIMQDANYIRVIKEQTGLVENKTEDKIDVLFFLVRNNKKSLREFGEYVSSLWEDNSIPYKLKSGEYRLQFRNMVGIKDSVLKSIGFVKADKKTKLWVYTGGEKMAEDNWDDMDEMEMAEVVEDDEIDEEDEAPKKKSGKKREKKEKKEKKSSKKDKDSSKKKKDKKSKKEKMPDEDASVEEDTDGEEELKLSKKEKKRDKKEKKEPKKDKKEKSRDKKEKKDKEDSKQAKEGLSLKEKIVQVAANIAKYVRSEVKDGVVSLSKADLSKALKEEIAPKNMKQLVEALEEKYNVEYDKKSGVIQIWKKAKKLPASLLKVK